MTAARASVSTVGARQPVRVEANFVLGGIAVGAVAVVGLWWQDTNFVHGWGDWLTNAGRITGLLAGYGVIVLLALMARVPAMERGVGTDRLARWHAMGGRYIVSLATAHTLLIIWGYAVLAHTSVVHESWTLLTSYTDVLMATVALGLLLVVGVASARAARRRLQYETWHFIHLYTYLAIALAFSHQFATGADFVANPQARVLWSALYIAVAAALVWYRLAVPVYASWRHHLRVVAVTPEGPDVWSVYVAGRDLHLLRSESGQFFRWRFLTPQLWWAANPYSLSAPPRPDRLRITVKVAGDHSAALARLRPGTRVLVEGPSGSFTATRRSRRKVLLIAGGVGITPLRTLFETLAGGPGEVTLLYRTTLAEDLVLRKELETIAARRRANLHYLVGPREDDLLGPRNLVALVPDVAAHDAFLCGPEPMMAHAAQSLRKAGVPRRHIHRESFVF